MPKAIPPNTTPAPVTRSSGRKPEPFPAEVLRAIDRLKAITVEAYDSLLLADGAPNPDYRLLDLCSEVIHVYRQHNEIERRWRDLIDAMDYSPPKRAEIDRLYAEKTRLNKVIGPALRAAGKLRAKTPAGIYAKALAIRASKTGPRLLTVTLAEDLIDCAGLRELLWAKEPAA